MKSITRKMITFAMLAAATNATATEATSADDIKVYEDEGAVVIITPNGVRKLVGTKSLIENDAYDIVLEADPFATKAANSAAKMATESAKSPPAPKPSPAPLSLADQARVSRLLYEANTHYYKGELHRAWQLIDDAEEIAPKSYSVLTMKGSLLFHAGNKDLAVKYWQESLEQNPDQKDVRRQIELATRPQNT